VGTTKFATPLKGDGFSTWIFIISQKDWEQEFAKCPLRTLSSEEIAQYGLAEFISAGDDVCMRVVEDNNQTKRVWLANKHLFVVYTRFG
jgi:hypothetical protein